MSTVEKLAGIKTGPDTEIQTFAATVHMAPDGSTVQDIKLVAPAIGELSGSGTVSPRKPWISRCARHCTPAVPPWRCWV